MDKRKRSGRASPLYVAALADKAKALKALQETTFPFSILYIDQTLYASLSEAFYLVNNLNGKQIF
jgi:hypothetical protein